MLNGFRILTSNLLEAERPGGGSDGLMEEHQSLLDAEAGSLLIQSESVFSTNSTSTGMNPQDDLEQSGHHPQSTTTPGEPPAIDAVNSTTSTPTSSNTTAAGGHQTCRKQPPSLHASGGQGTIVSRRRGRRRKRRNRSNSSHSEKMKDPSQGPIDAMCSMFLRMLCFDRAMVRNTLSCMNVMARVVVWSSVMALAAGVVWYSYELTTNGTDPHLIAWFSAGAFVLLGFPLSMGSIVAHLANYNQPHVQCYIVRILWMVPMYSMESWLCLRFHEYAIYIETLRDCYESFVLYSFLQFLIEVLGGEEALILMLKDKSPTRGSHMWGLQWCVKPWLMGQPIRRSDEEYNNEKDGASSPRPRHYRHSLKRVHWKSPFFVQCKFGVLQYVLLKFVCSFLAMILEMYGLYNEGNFTPKGGYLYVCLVTNLSQCWALYCLILFYYATHNELGPIRPVGKFLSVKSLVFFTWWQSVGISILYQMDMIPHYNDSKTTIDLSPEDVAKGIQDYLICVEMFLAAIVHTLVFPHSEYSPRAVQARARALNQSATNPGIWQQRKRLGRHHQYNTNQVLRNYHHQRDDKSANSESRSSFTGGDRSFFDLEMTTLSSGGAGTLSWEEPAQMDRDGKVVLLPLSPNRTRVASIDSVDSDLSPMNIPVYRGGTQDWSSPRAEQRSGWDKVGHQEDSLRDKSFPLSEALNVQPLSSLLQPSLHERQSTIEEGEEDALWESVDDEDDEGEFSSGDLSDDVVEEAHPRKHGFVRAFLDSAIPRDLRDNTVGIVKGDYVVEKKTLLHHATTSDHYDLFSYTRRTNFRTRNGADTKKEAHAN